MSLMRASRGW